MLRILHPRLRGFAAALTALLLLVHALAMAATMVPGAGDRATDAVAPAVSASPPCHGMAQAAPAAHDISHDAAMPDLPHGPCHHAGAACCAPVASPAITPAASLPLWQRAAWRLDGGAGPVCFCTSGPLRPPRTGVA